MRIDMTHKSLPEPVAVSAMLSADIAGSYQKTENSTYIKLTFLKLLLVGFSIGRPHLNVSYTVIRLGIFRLLGRRHYRGRYRKQQFQCTISDR